MSKVFIDKPSPFYNQLKQAGFIGKSCSQLFTDPNKLQLCQKLLDSQNSLEKSIQNTQSVQRQFHDLINIPNIIKLKNSQIDADIFRKKQEDAFHQDIKDIYGIGHNGGLSNDLMSYNNNLTNRNTQLRNNLNSNLSTLDSIKKYQAINQKLSSNLMDRKDKIDQVIQTKSRLIDINNESAREKTKATKVIMMGFSSMILLLFSIVGYLSSWFSLQTALVLSVTAVVISVFIVFILRDNPVKEFKKFATELENELIEQGNKLNVKALEWVDKNCDCPDDKEENSIYYDEDMGKGKIDNETFRRVSGKNIGDVTEGDSSEINLSEYPELQNIQNQIKQAKELIKQNI